MFAHAIEHVQTRGARIDSPQSSVHSAHGSIVHDHVVVS